MIKQITCSLNNFSLSSNLANTSLTLSCGPAVSFFLEVLIEFKEDFLSKLSSRLCVFLTVLIVRFSLLPFVFVL